MRFIRQVIDEMRKVIWPTKNELWTYFVVVVVFIVAIMAFTGILDTIFDRLVLWGLG
nr:preprotein translocase subunit SecE [Actinomyces gaoshouyii]